MSNSNRHNENNAFLNDLKKSIEFYNFNFLLLVILKCSHANVYLNVCAIGIEPRLKIQLKEHINFLFTIGTFINV